MKKPFLAKSKDIVKKGGNSKGRSEGCASHALALMGNAWGRWAESKAFGAEGFGVKMRVECEVRIR